MYTSKALTALACLWLFSAGATASSRTTNIKWRVLRPIYGGEPPPQALPPHAYPGVLPSPPYLGVLPPGVWREILNKQPTLTKSQNTTCSTMTSLRLRGGGATTTAKKIKPGSVTGNDFPAPDVTAEVAIFSDDKLFKEKYGFTLTSYLKKKRQLSASLGDAAKQLTKVSKDTGIAHVVGGSTGILSGLATVVGGAAVAVTGLAGAAAAPFTGGASMVLAAGLAGGAASAGTTIVSSIVNEYWVQSESKKIKNLIHTLASQDKVVLEAISALDVKLQRVEKPSKVSSAKSLPKTSLKPLITAVRLCQGASALTGQPLTPWLWIFDIVDGAKAIKRSDHAKAFRKFAADINTQVKQIEDLRNLANLATAN